MDGADVPWKMSNGALHKDMRQSFTSIPTHAADWGPPWYPIDSDSSLCPTSQSTHSIGNDKFFDGLEYARFFPHRITFASWGVMCATRREKCHNKVVGRLDTKFLGARTLPNDSIRGCPRAMRNEKDLFRILSWKISSDDVLLPWQTNMINEIPHQLNLIRPIYHRVLILLLIYPDPFILKTWNRRLRSNPSNLTLIN